MQVLNVNRWLVLLASRVTGLRGESEDDRWQAAAAIPRELWSAISQLLLLASTIIAILLAFASTILLQGLAGALPARAAIYGLPALPLLCGVMGTLECGLRRLREPDRVLVDMVVSPQPVPWRYDIRGNPAILLPSSVVGLVLAVTGAFVLASVDPWQFGA